MNNRKVNKQDTWIDTIYTKISTNRYSITIGTFSLSYSSGFKYHTQPNPMLLFHILNETVRGISVIWNVWTEVLEGIDCIAKSMEFHKWQVEEGRGYFWVLCKGSDYPWNITMQSLIPNDLEYPQWSIQGTFGIFDVNCSIGEGGCTDLLEVFYCHGHMSSAINGWIHTEIATAGVLRPRHEQVPGLLGLRFQRGKSRLKISQRNIWGAPLTAKLPWKWGMYMEYPLLVFGSFV